MASFGIRRTYGLLTLLANLQSTVSQITAPVDVVGYIVEDDTIGKANNISSHFEHLTDKTLMVLTSHFCYLRAIELPGLPQSRNRRKWTLCVLRYLDEVLDGHGLHRQKCTALRDDGIP